MLRRWPQTRMIQNCGSHHDTDILISSLLLAYLPDVLQQPSEVAMPASTLLSASTSVAGPVAGPSLSIVVPQRAYTSSSCSPFHFTICICSASIVVSDSYPSYWSSMLRSPRAYRVSKTSCTYSYRDCRTYLTSNSVKYTASPHHDCRTYLTSNSVKYTASPHHSSESSEKLSTSRRGL